MSRGKGHVPVRTCVSCGAKRSKKEMLRFVLSRDRGLLRDDSGHELGRGAYACRVPSCVEALMNRKRVETVFRVPREQRKKAG
ncbi:MAG: YlxR family protein [Deltaproteobacteria bacterium]|nr:YlxR family protein [Deltaproteobacteria bacterium]NTV56047.1 YlxR family protein [Deltaproteobacteria bacterium]